MKGANTNYMPDTVLNALYIDTYLSRDISKTRSQRRLVTKGCDQAHKKYSSKSFFH